MAQLDREDIEAALAAKGFLTEERKDHRFFHLHVNGKATGIKTFTSRGSGYKSYGDSLLGKMALQLKLKKAELVELVQCTLNEPDCVKKLKAQKFLI